MELLEKGRVRFWTQVEKCTSDCQVEYVFNDVIISQGKVRNNAAIIMPTPPPPSFKLNVTLLLMDQRFSVCLTVFRNT